MKFKIPKKSAKTTRLTFILLLFLNVFPCVSAIRAQDEEEKKPLNLFVVEKALRSPKATAANKNALLIEGVKTRKITFWLTAENEKKLRAWGANNALIEAVRQNQMPMYPMIQRDLKMDKPIEVKNSIAMEFVLIPAGEFTMGIDQSEVNSAGGTASREGTLPRFVKIKNEFYLGKFEVTQGQWKLLMGKNPSSFPDCGDDCPVENISWNQAQAFIKKLNEKADGYRYRLPSEAEWEYAARATMTTKYFWGDDADKKNWQFYAHNAQLSIAKVGSYLPNAFGLYDTSGNVWEMCEDVYRIDFRKAGDESAANQEGGPPEWKVVKGGGWGQSYDELRISKRDNILADSTYEGKGFRVAAIPIDPLTEPKLIVDDKLNDKAITPTEIASSIKGEVKVEVFVDENGKVQTVKVISGHPLLKEKAVALAKEAKFKEMKVDGKPVRVQGTLIYVFR